MPKRLSGLQKEVLHLYRASIRTAHTKPKENQVNFVSYIHEEFGKYRNLPRKDFTTIEHLLRVGNKKIATFSHPELTNIH
ncbi:hypothetical protein H758_YJM451D00611 [Saccharomyces cerevisiae YJM451]|nr:hypothetical protein H758_YJM451D00611 [Saccharomyces cerevisiae YJM451]AJV02966.1 hypothetical protein H810_YJM1399D00576 [Saccharomyces cerevisiae YJM1399]CAI4362033.1 CPI_1c_G0012260.mRNA.1.CDS.1 [Saccharomyces cerevisiae]CAI4363776.1 CPA_1a_G0012340.mRNA.1.CDS.1 [Saccharomyces cerevisiae]CAI4365233.1 BCN_G0012640.mRNA.1.CDS.1 [Saccharomyces cerevisiae]